MVTIGEPKKLVLTLALGAVMLMFAAIVVGFVRDDRSWVVPFSASTVCGLTLIVIRVRQWYTKTH
jgi:hypothetical protein